MTATAPPATNGHAARDETGVLSSVPRGTQLLHGGNRLVRVPDEIADAFRPGDRLTVVDATGDVLHVPAAVYDEVAAAVEHAGDAFTELTVLPNERIDRFYDLFAASLADDVVWALIQRANDEDVRIAKSRGRSTTRLVASATMRVRMIEALKLWRDMPPRREAVVDTVRHTGWSVDQVVSGLGVIGFIFEGRPNVFADATGVLRSGNTAVMRIGSDALGTARAIAAHALRPALHEAGLPSGAVVLVERAERAAGWALFSNRGLALAVARGSGQAVAQLGAVARQHGIPASLHGTGGAWIVASETALESDLELAVYNSLDSKKCNTLNTLCLVESIAERLVPVALAGIRRRSEQLGYAYKLHVTARARAYVPASLYSQHEIVQRASGDVREPIAEPIAEDGLGIEWEWEGTPEVTLHVVSNVASAIELFNQQSPHFVASLISQDQAEHDRFFRAVDAPFVGNGFTRWVDGQVALRRPELGLASWQVGRLFARS
ncbi:MAG TPA: aldehyde dehydrogenase family protein, partial [Chloroflexota bacterium]|nr:aldehyde dehydrogenase family protein [Chloroflexota bacterium]